MAKVDIKECRTRVNVLSVPDHSEDSEMDKVKEQDFVTESITNPEDTGDEKLERKEEITQPPAQSNYYIKS